MSEAVEVFKTDIDHKTKADEIVNILSRYFPPHKINVDYQDSDRVLRIESGILNVEEVLVILRKRGVEIEAL
jgi:hypothetical protein